MPEKDKPTTPTPRVDKSGPDVQQAVDTQPLPTIDSDPIIIKKDRSQDYSQEVPSEPPAPPTNDSDGSD